MERLILFSAFMLILLTYAIHAIAACMGRTLAVASHSACGSSAQFGPVDPTSCDQICDEEAEPVFASDGIVYRNLCLFHRAECEAAQNHTRLTIIARIDSCPSHHASIS